MKKLIFALIAAAVSGVVGESVEKGLNALDEKLHKPTEAETEPEEETETEEGE